MAASRLRRLAPLAPILPLLVVLCGSLAYSSSFSGAFLFDDQQSIVWNREIQRLWPPGQSLRPLLFFTLQLDYALSGLDTWSFHLTNLLIHLAAALALLGVVRRTLRFAALPERSPEWANAFSTAVAAVWVVHPLTTQGVTYIIQRGESLAGLFFLLTLYCAIRAFQSPRPGAWYAGTVVAFCLLLGSKELVVTAPLLVLLFDRAIVAGSFRESLRRRWPLYAAFVGLPVVALAARWAMGLSSWYMFVQVYAMLTGRDTTALADGTRAIVPRAPGTFTPLQYLANQPAVLLHYLRLAIWPRPLVFDYGWPGVESWRQVVPPAAVIGSLLAGSLWALRRRPVVGFLGAGFFLLLAPSSSILPLDDLAVEHRMYLPLAIIVVGVAFAIERPLRRLLAATVREPARVAALSVALCVVLLGAMTFQRNFTYASDLSMWADVVAKRPDNPRGHYNYGVALLQAGRRGQAIKAFEGTIRLQPSNAHAYANIGAALEELGNVEQARLWYVRALDIDPHLSSAHNNLGRILAQEGQLGQAMRHYDDAERYIMSYTDYYPLRRPLLAHLNNNIGLVLAQQGRMGKARSRYQQAILEDPGFAAAYNNLGLLTAAEGDADGAIAWYTKALEVEPGNATAHDNLGTTLLAAGRIDEALASYRQAVRLDPGRAAFHNDVGVALAALGAYEAARGAYAEAIRLDPGSGRAYDNMGLAWVAEGRSREAIDNFRAATRIDPADAEAYDNLGTALSREGDFEGALAAYERALSAAPDFARAHNNLGVLLAARGRIEEAIEHFREALRIDPQHASAAANLERLLEGRDAGH